MDTNKKMTELFNKNISTSVLSQLGVNPAYLDNVLEICWSRKNATYRVEGAGQFGTVMGRDELLAIIG